MSRALGRYELLRPLARGGMGEVFLARRRAAGVEKWLVVKRMRPERAGDVRFLELFMREARLSMSLAHQNIVPVFDFGRIDDQVFLAMERIEGKDLGSSLAKAAGPLAPMLAAFVAAECCQALDYAHRRRGTDGAPLGIVHRDVTPRNVLLSWSGEVKLTDFGIAALAQDASARSVIGTPAYMAPEQAQGEPTDARADVYAIGLVLREAWTGKRARAGTDREATLALAREGVLEPWPAGCEGPLRTIVDKATSSDPEARYADARAMLEALDAFLVEERAAKRGDGPARQLATWLAATWQKQDDVGPLEGTTEGAYDDAFEGSHLVSFLDDGALDVLGTGTQRSLAATVGDQVPVTDERRIEPPAVSRMARRRRWLFIAGALPAVALGAVIAARASRDQAPISKLPVPAAPAVPASPPVEIQRAMKQPVLDTGAPTAGVEPVESKPPPVEPRPPLIKKPRPAVLGSPRTAAAPAVATHKVLIHSTPWSYFMLDGSATQQESEHWIDLPAGPHTIHFLGQPSFRADKTVTIDVPDRDGFKVRETLEELPAP